MILAVGNSQHVIPSITSSVTITKPTGLSLGDMMVAHIGQAINFTDSFGTVVIPSGWTLLRTDSQTGTSPNTRSIICTKVVVPADISATNYLFTMNYVGSSGNVVGGAITQVQTSKPGILVTTSSSATVAGGTSETYSGITITNPDANSLILFFGTKSPVSQPNNTSGYAVTNNNPTWTETYDFDWAFSNYPLNLTMANAIRSATSATGDATDSATYSSGGAGVGVLLSIYYQTIPLSGASYALTGLAINLNRILHMIVVKGTYLLTGSSIREGRETGWTRIVKDISNWTNQSK